MRQGQTIIFLVYLLFGLYFLNTGLNFVVIPESITKLNQWIVFIGGILILLGAVNYLRAGKRFVSNLSR